MFVPAAVSLCSVNRLPGGDGPHTNKEVTNRAVLNYSVRRYLESKRWMFTQTCHCETILCGKRTGYPDCDTKTTIKVVSAAINVQCYCKSNMIVFITSLKGKTEALSVHLMVEPGLTLQLWLVETKIKWHNCYTCAKLQAYLGCSLQSGLQHVKQFQETWIYSVCCGRDFWTIVTCSL